MGEFESTKRMLTNIHFLRPAKISELFALERRGSDTRSPFSIVSFLDSVCIIVHFRHMDERVMYCWSDSNKRKLVLNRESSTHDVQCVKVSFLGVTLAQLAENNSNLSLLQAATSQTLMERVESRFMEIALRTRTLKFLMVVQGLFLWRMLVLIPTDVSLRANP